MPETLPPMLARAGELPDGRGLVLRGQVGRRPRALPLRARPALAALAQRLGHHGGLPGPRRASGRALHEHSAILDGEIVAFDAASAAATELPGPPAAHARPRRAPREAARGRGAGDVPDLRPAVARRSLADASSPTPSGASCCARSTSTGPHWQVPDAARTGLSRARCCWPRRAIGLEGVVAKRLDAPYEPGRRSASWVKVAPAQTAELVIGGWVPGEGGRSGGSARCCSASPTTTGAALPRARRLRPLGSRARRPRAADGAAGRGRRPVRAGAGHGAGPPRGAHWVEPEAAGEVAFTERSQDGLLRHPVWLRPARRPRRRRSC